MVAIEHRQKSAIIATDTTENSPIAVTSTTTTTTTTSSPRRSSDIINSNDILVLSASPNASTSSPPATTTTGTVATNFIVVAPRQDSKDQDHKHKIESLNTSSNLKDSLSKMSQSSSEASTVTAESAAVIVKQQQQKEGESVAKTHNATPEPTASVSKSAVSQRNVDFKIANKSNKDNANATKELTKKVLKLDLTGKELDEYSIKSPKSPIATRLPHQTSLTTVDVEDRKTLREALYHGIFHRHRRTIFAVGSFLRMLRSRNSSYNTIRSSSEGEEADEVR